MPLSTSLNLSTYSSVRVKGFVDGTELDRHTGLTETPTEMSAVVVYLSGVSIYRLYVILYATQCLSDMPMSLYYTIMLTFSEMDAFKSATCTERRPYVKYTSSAYVLIYGDSGQCEIPRLPL